MQYGHFDLENKEYVITNPATPAPWANYLGDPEYGAMISNNAAGYSSKHPEKTENPWKEPLYLQHGQFVFRLAFDCAKCEMSVMTSPK